MKKIILILTLSLLALPQISAIDGAVKSATPIKGLGTLAKEKNQTFFGQHKVDLAVGALIAFYAGVGIMLYKLIKLEHGKHKKTVITAYNDFKANYQLLAPVYEHIKKCTLSKNSSLSYVELEKFLQLMLSDTCQLLKASELDKSLTFDNPLDELKYHIIALNKSINMLRAWHTQYSYHLLQEELLISVTSDPVVYVTMQLDTAFSVAEELAKFCRLCESIRLENLTAVPVTK